MRLFHLARLIQETRDRLPSYSVHVGLPTHIVTVPLMSQWRFLKAMACNLLKLRQQFMRQSDHKVERTNSVLHMHAMVHVCLYTHTQRNDNNNNKLDSFLKD